MKSGWKIILIVVVIAILLGAICIGVGAMTGADFTRIWATLDNRYHVDMYYQYFVEVGNTLVTVLAP
ncbi:MAG: hypothetical protein J6J19_00095 [Oscillospiraceae bacterium]|nr:hypothetical protein [Oscillospiraceae bacterium]